jgi:hypothetical protein
MTCAPLVLELGVSFDQLVPTAVPAAAKPAKITPVNGAQRLQRLSIALPPRGGECEEQRLSVLIDDSCCYALKALSGRLPCRRPRDRLVVDYRMICGWRGSYLGRTRVVVWGDA